MPDPVHASPSFEEVYDDHVDFVWRSLRRLGVGEAHLDDAVQDVFVVVHRRLSGFEGRASIKTWLFAVALRVARHHRAKERRAAATREGVDPDELPAGPGGDPHAHATASEGHRLVDDFLARLGEDKRVVFMLAELEEMSTYEIAEAIGANRNTVASRLRAARQAFEDTVRRFQAAARRAP